jgi:hypothetical protein
MAVMSKFAGAALIGAVTSVAAYFSPAVREFIARWTAIDAPGGGWRILAIVLALANLKHLPFAWHVSLLLPIQQPSSQC